MRSKKRALLWVAVAMTGLPLTVFAGDAVPKNTYFPAHPASREVCTAIARQHEADLKSGKIKPSKEDQFVFEIGSLFERYYGDCLAAAPNTTQALLEVFPKQPVSLKACYEAGQHWIRAQVLDLRQPLPTSGVANGEQQASDFNAALANCLWQTPEGKRFVWPKTYAHLTDDTRRRYLLGNTPQGDAILVKADYDSYQVSLISPKAEPVVIDGATGGSARYFYGFDFKRYPLGKNAQSFAVLQASRSQESNGSEYSSLHRTLYSLLPAQAMAFAPTEDKPVYRTIHQGVVESAAHDGTAGAWKKSDVVLMIAPDPENIFAKIIEKTSTRTAKTQDALAAATSTVTEKMLRWNGSSFAEGEPTEWLAKLHTPPPVYPKIITENKVGEVVMVDGLGLRTHIVNKRPDANIPGSTHVEWLEIVSGVEATIAKKMNEAWADEAKKNAGDPEALVDEKNAVSYMDSTYEVKALHVYHDILSVFYKSGNMAPEMRSYDSGETVAYDLKTGEIIRWGESFPSPEAYAQFCGALGKRVANARDWGAVSDEECKIVPDKDGLKIIWESDAGGHYFEAKHLMLPYREVPLEAVKPGSQLATLVKDATH